MNTNSKALIAAIAVVICLTGQIPTAAGSDSSDCQDDETWFPEMYIVIDGESQWWPGGCAPFPNAELLPDGSIRLNDGTILEPPLDLGEFRVVGQPIAPLMGTLFRLPAPPIMTPPPAPPPPAPHPSRPSPPKKEVQNGYFFGKCSVPLGSDYKRHRTDEEWEEIQGDFLRHDDVTWSIELSGGGGSWGTWTVNTRDAAGLHPASKEGVWWLGSVPGIILTPNPMPPWNACTRKEITSSTYTRVDNKVQADRANPPNYNLCFANCQDWADTIENLTEG